jgi:deazaflavin-dependent oxidoreductase (nitroreductase family)
MNTELNRPDRRHARRPLGMMNSAVLALLHSPLHGLLDPGLCVLTYRGRRTGRRVTLPVVYARDGDRIVVLVGDAPDKQWWRNFTSPAPVEVRRGVRSRTGTARVVPPDDPSYPTAWRAYHERHHIDRQPTDRLLLIDTDRS